VVGWKAHISTLLKGHEFVQRSCSYIGLQ